MRGRAGKIARRVRRAVASVGLVVAVVVVVTPAIARGGGGDQLEYRVKAEFVERFTRFIEWPPTAFAGPDSPFVLCVIGRTPVANFLEALAQSRRIKDRRVELRRLQPNADLSGCHLVFIASDERPWLKQILSRAAGHPIVTVADSEGFGRAGVLINLVVDDQGRVRFEISPAGAHQSALTLNAQLLRLSQASSTEDVP